MSEIPPYLFIIFTSHFCPAFRAVTPPRFFCMSFCFANRASFHVRGTIIFNPFPMPYMFFVFSFEVVRLSAYRMVVTAAYRILPFLAHILMDAFFTVHFSSPTFITSAIYISTIPISPLILLCFRMILPLNVYR